MGTEKSTRHGKTDKTQKIALKQKIYGKWDFDTVLKQNVKSRKQKNYGFGLLLILEIKLVASTKQCDL